MQRGVHASVESPSIRSMQQMMDMQYRDYNKQIKSPVKTPLYREFGAVPATFSDIRKLRASSNINKFSKKA